METVNVRPIGLQGAVPTQIAEQRARSRTGTVPNDKIERVQVPDTRVFDNDGNGKVDIFDFIPEHHELTRIVKPEPRQVAAEYRSTAEKNGATELEGSTPEAHQATTKAVGISLQA